MRINKVCYLLICCFCGSVFSASAQMLDLLGGSAIGGAIMKGGVSSVNQGMNALKYTQLLQALSQNAQIIRINHMGRYNRVGKNDISGNPFHPYQFTVGNNGTSRFYIELSGVDINTCKRLVSERLGQADTMINGQSNNGTACTSASKIKFIFN